MTLQGELVRGMQALAIPAGEDTVRKLLAFLELIEKWNRVYNLTAVRGLDRMLTHHLLDSLAVAPYVSGGSVLDVGSGAGLPGIPLAITAPQLRVTLVDSNQKKSTFQQQAAIELELDNIEVVNTRLDAWETPRVFDTVVSRAFTDLAGYAAVAGRFCAPGGVLIAMKGAYPGDELREMSGPLHVDAVVPLTVPGLDAERHLVLMRAAYS